MRIAYNIDFEVAGVAFLIIVAIFVRLRYTTDRNSNRVFKRFYALLVAAEFMDVVTAVMISRSDVIPAGINMAANTIYMTLAAMTESTLVRYIGTFSTDQRIMRKHTITAYCITGFYMSALIMNLFTNVLFSFTNGEYVHGPLYMVTFLIPLFFILEAYYLIIFRRKLFGHNVIISAHMFNFLTLAGILTQMFLWPYTLTTYFGASLSALIMVFTLETPDYIKLRETMWRLEESNEELEHLRSNLQEEVDHRTEELRERQIQLETMTFETVRSLAFAIDAKDEYTNGHSKRVTQYAKMLAGELGWSDAAIDNLEMAAVLHDIGKIGVPDRILNKPGKLTDIEYELIKTHTMIGHDILENLPDIVHAREVARSHHERYDGKGYPDGLKGEEIPEAARLVCIADAYDAMSSKRVYRAELSKDRIRMELVNGRGTQFDPNMLDVFLKMFDAGKLPNGREKAKGGEVVRAIREFDSEEMDPLTQLPNRFAAEAKIRAAMEDDFGCLAIIDIDRLRRVNDRYGHRGGDAVITEFAKLLSAKIDRSISCRIGGDEFLFYVRGVEEKEARIWLNRLIDEFYQLRGDHEYLSDVSLTIGASCSKPGDQYDEVFSRADKAMYHMKQSGRSGAFIYLENQFGKSKAGANDLDALVRGLERRGEYEGVLQLEFDEFARIYELIGNIAERYHCNYELVMITLESPTGENLYQENMDKAMDCMREAITQVIRRVDICTRYSTVQYLVILMRVQSDDVQRIVDRIFRGFYRIYGSDKIQPAYATATVKAKTRELSEGIKEE